MTDLILTARKMHVHLKEAETTWQNGYSYRFRKNLNRISYHFCITQILQLPGSG